MAFKVSHSCAPSVERVGFDSRSNPKAFVQPSAASRNSLRGCRAVASTEAMALAHLAASPIGSLTGTRPPTWWLHHDSSTTNTLGPPSELRSPPRGLAPHPAFFLRNARCASNFPKQRQVPTSVPVALVPSALPTEAHTHHRCVLQSQGRTASTTAPPSGRSGLPRTHLA